MLKIKEFYFKNKKICDIAIVFTCCLLAWFSQYLPIQNISTQFLK